VTGIDTASDHEEKSMPKTSALLLTIGLLLSSSRVPGAESRAAEAIPPAVMTRAAQILKTTQSSGGLIVHLGSGDGRLAAALGTSGSYVVHGLDADGGNVRKARAYVDALGLYGKICFDRAGDALPYIDNLVNLLVLENPGGIARNEMMRVLVPGGRLYDLSGGKIETKPPMRGIDDWTHFLYDSTGNAVSHDTVVSPPRYLQWVGGSRWSRSHGHMGNMPGLVAAKGRVFSILDEGFVGRDQSTAAPAWSLIARDAYNGILLWRRPIKTFHSGFWGKKAGPLQLPERLVTDGERVYATLDVDGPVSAVDAVTGDLIREYPGTAGTEEILLNDQVLFLLRNPLRETGQHAEPIRAVLQKGFGGASGHGENEKEILAVRARSGELLWKKKSVVLATTLAVEGTHVCFHDGVKIVCLDRASGALKWSTPPVARMKPVVAQFTPELLIHQGVVLFLGGLRYELADLGKKLKKDADGKKKLPPEAREAARKRYTLIKKRPDLLHAFDAASGDKLWETAITDGVNCISKYSVFAIGDRVWTGDVAGGGSSKKTEGRNLYTGRDLRTGRIVKQFPRDIDFLNYHARCYPNKATVRYLMPNIRGVELVDFAEEKWSGNNWIRPGCSFGLMPSHGLIYTSPHACTCYAQSKLFGFNAVYGDAMGASKPVAVPATTRLETGTPSPLASRESDGAEWPTYRGNNRRTGSTPQSIGSRLDDLWTASPGGKLSALTVAGGRLFVSQIDTHRVLALSASDGRTQWRFTAGGRIDSPPTLYGGRAYFGCTDGYLYCLNAADGSLVWRFLAAADDRRLMSYGQLESVHPVHGSVLIHDGVVYCLAGRSMFLDGGLRLYRLDADTGKQLSVNVMNEINPFTGKPLQEKTIKQSMPPSMPDILSCDGRGVYMGVQPFDLNGKRTEVETHNEDLNPRTIYKLHQGEGRHIISPAGFLDDSRFHRSRWLYGKVYFGGHQDEWRADQVAPAGNMLVCDEENVLGYYGHIVIGQSALYNRIFSVRKDAAPPASSKILKHNWMVKSPLYINALLLADNQLFATGVTEEEKESLLQVYAAADGRKLAEYALPAMAVWDGLAAADGRLYVSLQNGAIVCKGAKPE
jgi:outer membrane protein assembly factor BamB